MEYQVVLEEGVSCMGGDERVVDSSYPTRSEAVRRCQEIVRESLADLEAQGFSGASLLRAYEARGVQPFIVPETDPPFDAVAYARLLAG